MSALDALLGRVESDGVAIELGGGLNFKAPLSARLNPTTRVIDVESNTEAVEDLEAQADDIESRLEELEAIFESVLTDGTGSGSTIVLDDGQIKIVPNFDSQDITTLGRLALGANPSTAGNVGVPHNTPAMSGRNSANDGNHSFLTWGSIANNTLGLGTTNIAGIVFDVTTAAVFTFRVNGTTEHELTSTLADFKTNGIVGGYVALGTNPADSGPVRIPHAGAAIAGRNSANDGNHSFLTWGTIANNWVGLGSANVAGVTVNCTSAGSLLLSVNSSAVITIQDAKIGFFGATAIVKPTVTGSRGGNAALASLLTALANLGLITNSTS